MKIIIDTVHEKITMINSIVYHQLDLTRQNTENHEYLLKNKSASPCYGAYEKVVSTKLGKFTIPSCFHLWRKDIGELYELVAKEKNPSELAFSRRNCAAAWATVVIDELSEIELLGEDKFRLRAGPKRFKKPVEVLIMEVLW